MRRINTVTVIGANGTMGAAVAGIIASFGGAKVYLVSRSYDKSNKAVEDAVKSIRSDSIRGRLIPKTYEELGECICESEWIFETITENWDLKKEINDIISKFRKPGTIVSTGTSGLSIEELKLSFDEEGKTLYFGTHFFNPPYNLPLCEVIPTSSSDLKVLDGLKEYLETVLLRKVVILKDRPAFLANRIGFQFLNEAVQLADTYKEKGGIDYIDSIFGGFTGRGLAPLVTVDFVGLDIHKAIVDNLLEKTNDFSNRSFILPCYLQELISRGRLGRKCGEGLYKIVRDENGDKSVLVYDILKGIYRNKRDYTFEFMKSMVHEINTGNYKSAMQILINDISEEARICKYLLINYIIYSIVISKEVAFDIHDVDTVMAYGFNWIPPLALIKIFGVDAIINEVNNNGMFNNITTQEIKQELLMAESIDLHIDYRRFLKARY